MKICHFSEDLYTSDLYNSHKPPKSITRSIYKIFEKLCSFFQHSSFLFRVVFSKCPPQESTQGPFHYLSLALNPRLSLRFHLRFFLFPHLTLYRFVRPLLGRPGRRGRLQRRRVGHEGARQTNRCSSCSANPHRFDPNNNEINIQLYKKYHNSPPKTNMNFHCALPYSTIQKSHPP